jgi:hypothetical protein
LSSVTSVDQKVVIERDDDWVFVELCYADETSISEVHWNVRVTTHESIDRLCLFLEAKRRREQVSREHREDRRRPAHRAAQQMTSLRKDGIARAERGTELGKLFFSPCVEFVAAVDQSHEWTRIDDERRAHDRPKLARWRLSAERLAGPSKEPTRS